MRILNLFAGIGGNRTLWGNKHEITALELNQEIANIYKKRFPNDKTIVGDAYQYFLDNFIHFDIVWASPPCTTHTKLVTCNVGHRYKNKNFKAKFPDLRLYSLILFLQHQFRGNWVVENVQGYYKPLIHPTCEIGRHWIWSNVVIQPKAKYIASFKGFGQEITKDYLQIKGIEDYVFELLDKTKIKNKKQVINNCVIPEEGKYILEQLIGKKQRSVFDFT